MDYRADFYFRWGIYGERTLKGGYMKMKEKMAEIEELLDVEEGSLSEDTRLSDLDEWDSIARLSLLIHFEETRDKELSGEEIKAFKTVKDILMLMD